MNDKELKDWIIINSSYVLNIKTGLGILSYQNEGYYWHSFILNHYGKKFAQVSTHKDNDVKSYEKIKSIFNAVMSDSGLKGIK